MTNSIKVAIDLDHSNQSTTSICSQKGSSLIYLCSTAQCNHLHQILLSELRIVYFYYFTGAKGDLSLSVNSCLSLSFNVALP